MLDPKHIISFQLYTMVMIGEGTLVLDRIKDQRKHLLTVEIKDISHNTKTIAELTLEAIWIYSRIELCDNVVKDLKKEKEGVMLAAEENKRLLETLQQPFAPIKGFDIASRVTEARDLVLNPISRFEDPFYGREII